MENLEQELNQVRRDRAALGQREAELVGQLREIESKQSEVKLASHIRAWIDSQNAMKGRAGNLHTTEVDFMSDDLHSALLPLAELTKQHSELTAEVTELRSQCAALEARDFEIRQKQHQHEENQRQQRHRSSAQGPSAEQVELRATRIERLRELQEFIGR